MNRLKNKMMSAIVPQLPRKVVSHYFGKAAFEELPYPLSGLTIKAFAKAVGANIDEAEKPLSEYKTIGEFFARRLRAGSRPIESDTVHPCDSKITQAGKIVDSVLIQAKGIQYTLPQFLPNTPWVDSMENGRFTTYYLSPKDYHRVHSPMNVKVHWLKYFPGELWPVNYWSLRNVPGVLAANERVAIGLETEKGNAILVMVGATNVGSMTFPFDKSIVTNKYPFKNKRLLVEYPKPIPLSVGSELGVFNLGSTVVLLTDKSLEWPYFDSCKVQMGQSVHPVDEPV